MVASPTVSGYGHLSTLDLLKLGALAAMVIDHVGLYFLPEQPVLRVLGRPAAVIFGFLIGYSATTHVPPSWIGLGLGLTFLDKALSDEDEDDNDDASDDHENQPALDILIALALTRILMPFFAWLHQVRVWLLLPAAAVLGFAAEATNAYFEYGTEITAVALLGLSRRLDDGSAMSRITIIGLAIIAFVTIGVQAIQFFEYEGELRYSMLAIIAATLTLLIVFRRGPLRGTPAWFCMPLCWLGRNTLLVYAAHVAAFQLISKAM